MSERSDKPLNTSENAPITDYRAIVVHSMTISAKELGTDVNNKLSNIGGVIAVKGGFARELLRSNLGLTSHGNHLNTTDVDIVVFETPSPVRQERIARREQIASLSKHFEPKDIEICDSTPGGLVHFFRTRDVTMNEIVMFKEGDNLRLLYSQECLEDLRNRIIRPSVHSSHTGLEPVWSIKNGNKILAPGLIGRSIYRKAKGDGDTFESNEVDFAASVKELGVDNLFKIGETFSQTPQLFEACIEVYKEFGVSDEMIGKVREKIQDPKVKKSRGTITSEIVED